jgi:hypothetical protein
MSGFSFTFVIICCRFTASWLINKHTMCAKKSSKSTKNLLVATDKALIDTFKIHSFTFYKDNDLLSLFSYRHYLALVLLNMQEHFLKKYKVVAVPNEQYLGFYKKRGTKMSTVKQERVMESINFLLPVDYTQLYYDLMHTYYINEKSDSTSYSISIFFEYIVSFIGKKQLKFLSVEF